MATPDGPIPFPGFSNLPPPDDRTILSFSVGEESQVPMTKNPIHFTVWYRNGRVSNAWGVRVTDAGDAYIYCRDGLKGQKISLHASGKQHISLDPNPAASVTRKEYMNQWYEPDEGIATFKLIFPPWGVQLSGEQVKKSVPKKSDLFIEGHHEFLTVVSFYIVNENAAMTKGTLPAFLMGELPLTPGKKLGITAGWEPDNGFKTKVEEALPQIAQTVAGRTSEQDLEQVNALCLMGWNSSPNSAFMTTIPVRYRPKF